MSATLLLKEIDDGADYNLFARELEKIKGSGFSTRTELLTTIPGSRSIASPVFYGTGAIAGVILLIGFETKPPEFPEKKYITDLQQAALRVSQRRAARI